MPLGGYRDARLRVVEPPTPYIQLPLPTPTAGLVSTGKSNVAFKLFHPNGRCEVDQVVSCTC